MAALNPTTARAGLRTLVLLRHSTKPSPSLLHSTTSLLRSRPSPSPFPFATTPHHRLFSSTPITSGWLPWSSTSGPTNVPTVIQPEATIAFPEPSEQATASASAATSTSPSTPISEPILVNSSSGTPVDAATTSVEPTFHLPGTEIFTGTLNLTPLDGSWGPHPIMRLQSMFLQLHESFPLLSPTGLTWIILIPTITLLLRLLLFTFQVRAQSNAARMALIQPQMLSGMEKLKAAKARGDFTGAQAAQMETQALMTKHNVNPIRNLVFPLAQATVFMTMFFALKGLAGAGLPSMMSEGGGWVMDLTQPDPYWALPVASTALTLATLETGVDSTTQVQTSTTKNMKMFFRIMLVIALPFIAYFPAALLLYWTTNNSISLLQSLLLKQPFIRTLFGIPYVPPKPQPGEKGYVAEPSFADAFRNMQVGAQEKWDATKEATEKERVRREKWENVSRAEVYEPRAPTGKRESGGQVRRQLEEISGETERMGEIRAVRRDVVEGGREEEKARRVQAARERRRRQ